MSKTQSSFAGRDREVEDKIIDATVKCFRRYGIRKTSMEDIAKAAKLSRPTIYRYFPSRHHLAVEVLLREVRDHTRLVVPVIKEYAYPPRALIEGIVFDIATAQEHPYTSILVSDAGNELLSRVHGSEDVMLEAMSEQWLPSLTRWAPPSPARGEGMKAPPPPPLSLRLDRRVYLRRRARVAPEAAPSPRFKLTLKSRSLSHGVRACSC